jgi:Bacterial DNA-binding protein
MKASTDDLRDAMRGKNADDLRDIAQSSDNQYTAEARASAAAELAARRDEPATAPEEHSHQPERKKTSVVSKVLAVFAVLYFFRVLVNILQHVLFSKWELPYPGWASWPPIAVLLCALGWRYSRCDHEEGVRSLDLQESRQGVPLAHVDEVLNAVLDIIVELTAGGQEIHLNDLGRFEVKDRKARKTTAHWEESKPEHIVGGGPRLTFSSFDNVNKKIAAIRW